MNGPQDTGSHANGSTAPSRQPQSFLTTAKQSWRQWLVVAALVYGLLAIPISLWPTLTLINQPYGGFLWTWDTQTGLYRVDEAFVSPDSQLQKADYLLTVETLAATPHLSVQAQGLYNQYTAVCTATPPPTPSNLTYTVLRQGQSVSLESPVSCFRFGDWLQLVTLPVIMSLLIWTMGLAVFQANRRQAQNTAFAVFTSFSAAVIAKQIFHEAGIETAFSQAVAFFISAPAPVLSAAVFLYLAAILPRRHPFTLLKRNGWWFYGLLPAIILGIGWWHFYAAVAWSPTVARANTLFAGGVMLLRYAGPLILLLRSLYLYHRAADRQSQGQAKLIAASMTPAVLLIPFEMALHLPQLSRWWLPVSQNVLLFLSSLSFVGLAFAILRYQLFPGRMRALHVLMIVFTVLAVSFAVIPLFNFDSGLQIAFFFLTLLGISFFWTRQTPLRQTLRRFTLPGVIGEKELTQFNMDIQGSYDLETLPWQILDSLERHLEVSFVALWLHHEGDILMLETFTDHAPVSALPEVLPLTTGQRSGAVRSQSGSLAAAGCEIALFLVVENENIGVIGLGPRWTEDIFDETDLQPLTVMAYQAALALHTAQQIRTISQIPFQIERAEMRERERIAQDLHDSTQANLTQLLFELEKIRGQLMINPSLAGEFVDQASNQVNRAARELRAIIRDLLPQQLSKYSLQALLQQHIDRLQARYPATGFAVDIATGTVAMLSQAAQVALLRVCHQAIDNALTHASPKQISIKIWSDVNGQRLQFQIKDDGRGFLPPDIDRLRMQDRHGIDIMQTRIERHNGHFQLDSSPGNGTVIEGWLPYRHN